MLQRQIARMVAQYGVELWNGQGVGRGGGHYFTVVSPKIVYYRWVGSGRKRENGMKSYSLL